MQARRMLVSISLAATLLAASAASGEGTLSGGSSAPGQSRLRTQTDAPPASIAEPRVGGRDEVWWRTKSIDHREDVAKAEQRVAECEKRDAQKRLDSGLTPLDACEAKVSAVEKAEDKLSDFEDLARSKGVPPGWLR